MITIEQREARKTFEPIVPGLMEPPTPGVYEGIAAETYHAWDACSASRLKKLRDSGRHMLRSLSDPDETAQMALGTAAHACILEPAEFAKQYAIGPDVKLNTKAGKDEWENFVAENPGKFHVRGADGEKIKGMREELWSDPDISAVLSAEASREISIIWDDPATGVRCKSRIDLLANHQMTMADLKTTGDASADAWKYSAEKFGYHIQNDFYMSGLAVLAAMGMAPVIDTFAFLVVESEPYHGTGMYLLDEDSIEAGRRRRINLIHEYSRCLETGRWGGYPRGFQTLRLPEREITAANNIQGE